MQPEKFKSRVNLKIPTGSLRFDLFVAISTFVMIFGAYLDSWAHNHVPELETFFTSWHAVLYSGFLASTIVLLFEFFKNIRQGYNFRSAVPHGYGLSLIGLAIFAVGGVGDMFWHELFGVEVGVEGALSATHQILDLGAILLISGPLRAGWNRSEKVQGWKTLVAVILSALVTLSALVLMTQVASPFTNVVAGGGFNPGIDIAAHEGHNHGFGSGNGEHFQVLGIVSIMLQTGLSLGMIFVIIRRWGVMVPLGAIGALWVVPNLAILSMKDEFRFGPAIIISGIVAEILFRNLRPTYQRIISLRTFAVIVPLISYTLYFLTLYLTESVLWWSIHTLTGAVSAAAATGLLLSVVAVPSGVEQ